MGKNWSPVLIQLLPILKTLDMFPGLMAGYDYKNLAEMQELRVKGREWIFICTYPVPATGTRNLFSILMMIQ